MKSELLIPLLIMGVMVFSGCISFNAEVKPKVQFMECDISSDIVIQCDDGTIIKTDDGTIIPESCTSSPSTSFIRVPTARVRYGIINEGGPGRIKVTIKGLLTGINTTTGSSGITHDRGYAKTFETRIYDDFMNGKSTYISDEYEYELGIDEEIMNCLVEVEGIK